MFHKNSKIKLYNKRTDTQNPRYMMMMIGCSPSAFETRPWLAVICASEVEEIGSYQHWKVVLAPRTRFLQSLDSGGMFNSPTSGSGRMVTGSGGHFRRCRPVAAVGSAIGRGNKVRSCCGKFARRDRRYPAPSGLDVGGITHLELQKRFRSSII